MRDLQAARGTSLTSAASPTQARRDARLLFLAIAVVGLAVDVLTKVLAVAQLAPLTPVPLLGGLLTLRLIRNPGAAFSSGTEFTVVFALAAVAVLLFVWIRLAPRVAHRGWAVALGLLSAGVSGNLVDRLFRAPGVLRGHVVDFLQLPYWPIFNVADICITSAAVLIMFWSVVRDTGLDGRRYGRGAADQSVAAEPRADG